VKFWSVGEWADRTGATRTLHHYDEIGLLRPTMRTGPRHRRYTAADPRRLHRVLEQPEAMRRQRAASRLKPSLLGCAAPRDQPGMAGSA
jgi:hypothetical protein